MPTSERQPFGERQSRLRGGQFGHRDRAHLLSALRGIGALCEHLHQTFVSNGGEVRYRAKVERILVKDDHVTGVRLRDRSEISAPVVISNLSPDHTLIDLVDTEHLPADLPAV